MSKYEPLIEYLRTSPTADIRLDLEEIDEILGFSLPPSARQYQAWWANSATDDSHKWAQDWQAEGWRVTEVDLSGGSIRFQQDSNSTFETTATKRNAALSNWRKELIALQELGGKATVASIHEKLKATYGQFDAENIRKDLIMLSVNDEKRFAYRAWELRHGKAKEAMDHVFDAGGVGMDRSYELYDAKNHGRWQVYQKPGGGLGLSRTEPTMGQALDDALSQTPEFDPETATDGKSRVLRSIAVRKGAPKFREAIFKAFGARCCVSGCTLQPVLEAAHISPYDGAQTNDVTNGLLLRADIHTLFDLGLIVIDANTFKICVHPSLRQHAEYAAFNGMPLKQSQPKPSKIALQGHRERHAKTWTEPSQEV